MPLSRRLCNIIVGATLLLLGSCEISGPDSVLLSASLDPSLASQSQALAGRGEIISLDPEGPVAPGFLGGSQESGFSSEEAEDPKAPQSQYFWDEGGELNDTNLDPDPTEGDSPGAFQPPSLPPSFPGEMPGDLNSSTSLVPLGESLEPDLWEIQGETSGGPAEPAYDPPATDTAPLTHAPTTDSDMAVGPVHQWDGGDAQGTAPPLEEGLAEGEEPGVTHAEVSAQLTTVVGVAEYSHTDEMEGVDLPSVLTAVQRGVAQSGWVHHTPLTTVPSSSPSSTSFPHTVALTDTPWNKAAPTLPPRGPEPDLSHGGTGFNSETDFLDKHPLHDSLQVVCVDWIELTGKGYVILNMSENFDCDEFRVESGDQLLEMLETAFSRKMNSPQGSWLISLSKPTRQDHQLLMTLASEQGVIATKDVLSMLGEIRRGLHDIGIQNFTSVSSCQSRPSQTRSDYGKLFVVLVIIGSVCVVIIASGLIYICWQRRLPKMKNMSRGEELHFVENGCHDNPTLDVTSDNQSEMLEKKNNVNVNGVVAGGGGGSGWQVLVNKPGKEEAENQEEDTHL
ncbi:hypothetical protein SKAU_G00156060 [Synaphobranchus kaupii]|uniref:Podocalyxin-like protein 2 n=1 Tax=Synaphobranchus kaupii TaxID=118154 RepID=A0A9Q1FHP4_SYNKA|nr:hypothetical protein SKAU_G00156060 [Synaphobranchus kaupii]